MQHVIYVVILLAKTFIIYVIIVFFCCCCFFSSLFSFFIERWKQAETIKASKQTNKNAGYMLLFLQVMQSLGTFCHMCFATKIRVQICDKVLFIEDQNGCMANWMPFNILMNQKHMIEKRKRKERILNAIKMLVNTIVQGSPFPFPLWFFSVFLSNCFIFARDDEGHSLNLQEMFGKQYDEF